MIPQACSQQGQQLRLLSLQHQGSALPSTQITYPPSFGISTSDRSVSTPNTLVALVVENITQSRVLPVWKAQVAFPQRATIYTIVVGQHRRWLLTQPAATVREPERSSSLQVPVLGVRLDPGTDDLGK